MRIALIHVPRSIDTFTINLLSSKLNLTNYEGFYNQILISDDDESIIAANIKLYDQDDYIVKFSMEPLLKNEKINYNNINWGIFDKIILAERRNITSHVITTCLLNLNIHVGEMQSPMYLKLDESFHNIKKIIIDLTNQYKIYKTELTQNFTDKCVTLMYDNRETYLDTLNNIHEKTFTNLDVEGNTRIQQSPLFLQELSSKISNYTEIELSVDEYTRQTKIQ
jgi:hypothetical protein